MTSKRPPIRDLHGYYLASFTAVCGGRPAAIRAQSDRYIGAALALGALDARAHLTPELPVLPEEEGSPCLGPLRTPAELIAAIRALLGSPARASVERSA